MVTHTRTHARTHPPTHAHMHAHTHVGLLPYLHDVASLGRYANCGLLAAVSCTKVHNVTGNKYKFAQIVQETAANDHKFGQLLYKILTHYSR